MYFWNYGIHWDNLKDDEVVDEVVDYNWLEKKTHLGCISFILFESFRRLSLEINLSEGKQKTVLSEQYYNGMQ